MVILILKGTALLSRVLSHKWKQNPARMCPAALFCCCKIVFDAQTDVTVSREQLHFLSVTE